MEKGDRLEINKILEIYKDQKGNPDYISLAAIPMKDRLYELAKEDFPKAVSLVSVGLTIALENINLKNGLTDVQIVNLAEEIVDSSSEDQLSYEDFMMFIQGFMRGKYGKFYESLDTPKFFTMFEEYRQERFKTVMDWKHNKHLEYKNLGDPERSGSKMTAFDEHLSAFTKKLSAKNDEIRELREERKRNQ